MFKERKKDLESLASNNQFSTPDLPTPAIMALRAGDDEPIQNSVRSVLDSYATQMDFVYMAASNFAREMRQEGPDASRFGKHPFLAEAEQSEAGQIYRQIKAAETESTQKRPESTGTWSTQRYGASVSDAACSHVALCHATLHD